MPTTEPERRVWLKLVRARLLGVMRAVEALPETAAGALLVGDQESPTGMILVERNRVCWSAAVGMGARLRDLLRSHCSLPIDEGELELLYARCREEQRPLGEALVAGGFVSPDQMRATMKAHTVESLLALDAAFDEDVSELPLSWVERADRGYNPRYTFTAAEVLAAVGARFVDETAQELIADHLQQLAGTGCAAIAFLDDDAAAPLFVGVLPTLWLPTADLIELADWASAALAASAGFSSAVAHACAQRSDGGTVAWIYEGQPFAAVCPTTQSLQRLVSTLDNDSLALVLATKLPVLDRVRGRVVHRDRTSNSQGE